MTKKRSVIGWTVPVLLLVLSGSAHAQATRTWVSGVGDDVNPCSRTAPCKTFAGAISKTAAQGQINVLDAGAFGAVTITKSITIDASGNFAGVLATLGSNGIVVNAGSADVVVLRGLTIDGANTGGNGIRFLAGNTLHVENCVINNFAQKGIDAQPSTPSFVLIKDTVVRNNLAGGVNGGGILLKPASGGSIRAELTNVRSERNVFGLRTENNTETVVRDSIFTSNNTAGIIAFGGVNAQIDIDETIVSNNVTQGVTADGAAAVVRLSNVMVTNNNSTGINPINGGQVLSFGTNRIAGNNPDGTFTPSALGEQ